MQGMNPADVIRAAPEALLEQNMFYLQLKLILGQRNQEIARLKEVNVNQKKDIDELKSRYETLEKTHQYVLPNISDPSHSKTSF